jgi:hypothetical protein
MGAEAKRFLTQTKSPAAIVESEPSSAVAA